MSSQSSQVILNAIRHIVRALRVSSRELEKSLGLSGAQFFVLQKLAGASELSINELAARTHTDQSSVSVVVSRLVDRGLVRSAVSSEDARRRSLSLTPKGNKLLVHSSETPQERLLQAINRLPADDRGYLANLLQQLIAEAGLSADSAPMFFEDDSPPAEPHK
jgi:DNA-binding MarR family transcriptional regulator